jgi:hypothetical protein
MRRIAVASMPFLCSLAMGESGDTEFGDVGPARDPSTENRIPEETDVDR